MTAQELKTFLEQWGLSQTEAALLFGIKQQVVSDIVNGKREKIPTYIQKAFLFFSLLPHKQQQQLVNETTQANKAMQRTAQSRRR